MSVPSVRKAPTIGVVAATAGVSVATVSRVMNRDSRVRSESRTRVEAAIREIGYLPDAAARSLRSRSTRQLSLVVDDIGNPAYVEIMRSLQGVAREHGYRLLVQSTDGRAAEEREILAALGQRYVDGLVLTSTRFTADVMGQLRQAPVPVVVIGTLPGDAQVDAVSSDAHGGAYAAAQHLVAQGSTAFAMINGPEDTRPATTRLQGFREGLATSGSATDLLVRYAPFTAAAGYEAMQEILRQGTRPDGVLGANDLLAIGAIEACLDAGLDVPGDVAVVGMDNTRDALVCRPRLSSVDLRFPDRGRLAGQMLLERIDGRYDGAVRRVQLQTELFERQSSTRLAVNEQ